jgi:hypothetical protein
MVQQYGLSGDAHLATLVARLDDFRRKVVVARNKIISHSDRLAIHAGAALGNVPDSDWNQFWVDLQEVIAIIHKHARGTEFYINAVGGLSDVDLLLKALKHAECFRQIRRQRACTSLRLSRAKRVTLLKSGQARHDAARLCAGNAVALLG